MDFLLAMTFSSCLVSIFSPSSLTIFFLPLLPPPPTPLRATKRGVFFRQACTGGWRRGAKLERVVVVVESGCWDRSIFKALSFHLFSFFISLLFRGKKNRRREMKKKKKKMEVYTCSRIGMVQMANTHKGKLLRDNSPAYPPCQNTPSNPPTPHPNRPQLPGGDLYLCLAEQTQSHPNVTPNEHQTGLTCSHTTVDFI